MSSAAAGKSSNKLSLTLSLSTRYQLLAAMLPGIPYWLSRNNALILSHKPIFCAACLVLLPENPSRLESKTYQILKGMLKVLELSENDLCVAWMTEDEGDREGQGSHPGVANYQHKLKQEIVKWAPLSVLILGESLAQRVLEKDLPLDELRMIKEIPGISAFVQASYHPHVLQENPLEKKKAYQDLLNLKEWLLNLKSL